MRQLIIASNRLPFKIEKREGKFLFKQSSGGLVSALQSLPCLEMRIKWIGTANFKQSVWEIAKETLTEPVFEIEPIFIEKRKYHLYYNGFSNTTIWPLFHYFPSYAEYTNPCYNAYKDVNREFAEVIIRDAEPNAIVWIHDYHLMLLPGLIKQARPDLQVGFFLHIPFPSYEIFKLVPEGWRTDILESLMNSDIVGLHTKEYVNHFRKSLNYFSGISLIDQTIGLNEFTTLIKAYPISIDFQKFNDSFNKTVVKRLRDEIRKKYPDVKIIFSVDRLDYTKGVMNRLEAYEDLLETRPEYRDKVVFVINVIPSRDEIEKYAERKKMIEENVGRINGLYGSVYWQPVIYQYRHLTFNQLLSFYTVADVALVTPMRDGMNLVAKEYVASRKDKKGVLILSEFAGAASELQEAILVNPNDLHVMRDGIIKALSLSEEEQFKCMDAMQTTLKENDIYKWTRSFIGDLSRKENEPELTYNDL